MCIFDLYLMCICIMYVYYFMYECLFTSGVLSLYIKKSILFFLHLYLYSVFDVIILIHTLVLPYCVCVCVCVCVPAWVRVCSNAAVF